MFMFEHVGSTSRSGFMLLKLLIHGDDILYGTARSLLARGKWLIALTNWHQLFVSSPAAETRHAVLYGAPCPSMSMPSMMSVWFWMSADNCTWRVNSCIIYTVCAREARVGGVGTGSFRTYFVICRVAITFHCLFFTGSPVTAKHVYLGSGAVYRFRSGFLCCT